jgi:hypothetical protein
MSRTPFVFLLAAAVLSAPQARAQVEVAPVPREIRADGSRDPAPQVAPAKAENPLEVVARIVKNSNAVGDKLAASDTGPTTRGTQETILKDIESLIDRQENPPPPKPDQNQDKNDQKDKTPDDVTKKEDMSPKGGMNDKQPMKGDPGGGKKEPMAGGIQEPTGGGEQPMGRRPRQKAGEEPKEKDDQAKGGQGGKQQAKTDPRKDPKTATTAPAKPGDPTDPLRATLPTEDEIVKDVWGHLPDKLRQQATQYYQQDFMPRYTELLKLYYSSLSEKGGKK